MEDCLLISYWARHRCHEIFKINIWNIYIFQVNIIVIYFVSDCHLLQNKPIRYANLYPMAKIGGSVNIICRQVHGAVNNLYLFVIYVNSNLPYINWLTENNWLQLCEWHHQTEAYWLEMNYVTDTSRLKLTY